MATGGYIGVTNSSKKVKGIYIGVGNVSKKVKRAYIGIGNIAKLWWKVYSYQQNAIIVQSSGSCIIHTTYNAETSHHALLHRRDDYTNGGYYADFISPYGALSQIKMAASNHDSYSSIAPSGHIGELIVADRWTGANGTFCIYDSNLSLTTLPVPMNIDEDIYGGSITSFNDCCMYIGSEYTAQKHWWIYKISTNLTVNSVSNYFLLSSNCQVCSLGEASLIVTISRIGGINKNLVEISNTTRTDTDPYMIQQTLSENNGYAIAFRNVSYPNYSKARQPIAINTNFVVTATLEKPAISNNFAVCVFDDETFVSGTANDSNNRSLKYDRNMVLTQVENSRMAGSINSCGDVLYLSLGNVVDKYG